MAFCLCFTWRRSWLLVHRPLCTVATRARHVNHVPPDRRIRLCKCTQKWMFYLFATILILLYSATFPAAILSSPMTVDSISVYSHVVFTHLHILIVTVKLNVWLDPLLPCLYSCTFSCGIVTVCALYQCKTPECGRISKPVTLSSWKVYFEGSSLGE